MKEAKLKALGSSSTEYHFDGPHEDLLENFENPFWQTPERQKDGEPVRNQFNATGSVHIEVPEFTSLCPKTGQPDFATIVIDYIPRQWCVESKSLKLYLGSFRNAGEFHETCVSTIANALIRLCEPYQIRVEGRFTPRGGIPFWPTAQWVHPDLQERQNREPQRIVTPR